MTTHTFDVVPNAMQMAFESNSGLSVSALINSAQTIDRGGAKWRAVLTYTNIYSDDRGKLLGLIAALRGQTNRARILAYDNPARGNYGGTPVVNGGGQTGYTLNCSGAGTVTDWIKAGDYFSVDVNGEHELKMATADASSSGGAITLTFEPRLRASPANGAAVYVGTSTYPRGIFLFEGVRNGWSSKPGAISKLSDITLSFVEDVFATQ